MPTRIEQSDRLASQTIDLLVVGGGIVGAGVARDAARRGLAVAVVDRRDFAFGTSGRSSRLLHGGLRYLAQGRIGLVRESGSEKMILRRIAPHLAEPLPFIFPTYRGTGWKRWKLGIGVKIYDLLSGRSNLGPSSVLDPVDVTRQLSGLEARGLTGAVRYFDAFTNDARLVLDTLRSAEASGATVLNYVELVSARWEDGAWRCDVKDDETGRQFEIKAKSVVNAAGARAGGFPASQVRLRLTKGVHLVIDRERLPVPGAVVMTEGPRILFVIPWGERVILGTTDTDYDGPLDSPTCEPKDAEYVLDVVNRSFPIARITSRDVIAAWAGLRPLIADPRGRPSDISRAHHIYVGDQGWIDVAGGKLTTYRLMAEQAVDKVARFVGREVPPSDTAGVPLFDKESPAFSGVVPPEVSKEAVVHFCRNEWARHLDDVMIRRSGWRFYHRDHDRIAGRVALWMAETNGWSESQTAVELARYRRMTATAAPEWEALPRDQSKETLAG